MFVILLEYQQAPEVMALHVAAHRAYLAEQYTAGKLVLSGPQVSAQGGVIIARLRTQAEIDALMQGDPYIREGVATYRAIEFVARATTPELAEFVETMN